MNASIESNEKNQLLEDLSQTNAPFIDFEIQKMAIFVRCSEDIERSLKSLEDSMDNNTTSSNNLAKKVMLLNIILTAATVIGTILATYKLFNP